MQLMLLLIAGMLAAVATASGATLTECGASDGYGYYFAGGLVPANKAGFTKDGITGGRIILNLYDNNEVDLLLKDASGGTSSVKQQGARLSLLPVSNGLINVMVVYAGGGSVEQYVFQLDGRGNGTVVHTQVRTVSDKVNKATLLTAQCSAPR
jgi:hypothetical protein